MIHIDVYRVGLGNALHTVRVTGNWRMFRWHLRSGWRRRSFWGLWQAEWDGCHRAVRGFTRLGTVAKAGRRIEEMA